MGGAASSTSGGGPAHRQATILRCSACVTAGGGGEETSSSSATAASTITVTTTTTAPAAVGVGGAELRGHGQRKSEEGEEEVDNSVAATEAAAAAAAAAAAPPPSSPSHATLQACVVGKEEGHLPRSSQHCVALSTPESLLQHYFGDIRTAFFTLYPDLASSFVLNDFKSVSAEHRDRFVRAAAERLAVVEQQQQVGSSGGDVDSSSDGAGVGPPPYKISILLHGTPCENVRSILRNSHRGGLCGHTMCWFTRGVGIAFCYTSRGRRGAYHYYYDDGCCCHTCCNFCFDIWMTGRASVVVFAVIEPTSVELPEGPYIVTTDDLAMQFPIGRATIPHAASRGY